ncbi:uncharacterized protein CLAFUR5_13942 [Fulvia fulva]|uniref:small monomeric GTPase n=1 Tax=Passalora fulva TaxID=5499 RepID=A0A9Q8UVY4_PASFU|nr:uncharacterized protein CLAFUR5_13942 [Fulvia fulva]KAK4611281.1 hypothetical protein CLAFUR0_14114 [Fulvia fulva]UJO24461.1 hypothetical protein CLAFUR5_13942 [Fulvia fulva]WPV37125.1 hypothetical protein CLAFUW7_14118 [Fulvia fulva]
MSLDVTQERLEPNTQSIAPGRNELSACHRFCSTPELIFLCFELAPLQTVVNYQRVCKSWYSIVSSSDILQHRLNHNEYGLALNGRQQLVLQHQIDTLILRCREDPCIGYLVNDHSDDDVPDRHWQIRHTALGRQIGSYWIDECSQASRQRRVRYELPPVCFANFHPPDAAILVYSVSDYESFEEIRQFYYTYYGYVKDSNKRMNRTMPFLIVVANKTDLPEHEWQVPAEVGRHFNDSIDAPFLQVSTKTGEGIPQDASDVVVKRILYEHWMTRVRLTLHGWSRNRARSSWAGAVLQSLISFFQVRLLG